MRTRTVTHYATVADQYVRVAGGQAWANPEYALSSYGNVGTSVSNIAGSTQIQYPVGPGYALTYNYSNPALVPAYVPQANEAAVVPNALRFSGFTIDDVGVTADCIVTNLFVYVEYTNNSTLPGYGGVVKEDNPDGTNWLVTVTKPNGTKLLRKRLLGVAKTTSKIERGRISCLKDQSWSTDTFGPDIAPNAFLRGQTAVSYYPARQEFFEATSEIQALTIGEVNDPNFFVDLWFGKFGSFGTSGVIKVKSVGISVEYIQRTGKTSNILWPLAVSANYQISGNISPRGWQRVDLALSPDAPQSEARLINPSDADNPNPGYYGFQTGVHNTFTSFYQYYDSVNTNAYNDPWRSFNTKIITAKMPALENIDNTTNSISDIIIDARYVIDSNKDSTTSGPIHLLKWTFYLLDGWPSSNDPPGTHHHRMIINDPGIRSDNYYLSGTVGQDWMLDAGDWNNTEKDWYGRYATHQWTMKHVPIIRNDSIYSTEIINTITYPGMVYDPLWIEKALQSGNLFLGVSLGLDPNGQGGQQIPLPEGYLKIDSFGIRVKYNDVSGPPPPGPVVGQYDQLVRNTP